MSAPRSQLGYRVFARQKKTDSWVEQEFVYCDGFTEVASPDVGEATLHFNYGRIEAAGGTSFTTRQKKDLAGWYVKIELAQADPDKPRKWIGLVIWVSDSLWGDLSLDPDSPATKIPTGQQTFHCRDLGFILSRTFVDTSVVETSGSEQRIGRAIGFNYGQGRDSDHERIANMGGFGENDAPIFAHQLKDAEEWTASYIVTYLLHYQVPTNESGADVLEWQAPDTDDAKILDVLEPTLQTQGKSIKQILDELIDRRRLVGWRIALDDSERPQIDVFTFNNETITLPSGKTIPPNPHRKAWNFGSDVSIRQAVLVEDDATRYDQVIARGQPLGACFTIGHDLGSSLEPDWSPDLQSEYNAGASTASGYAELSTQKKQVANEEYRQSLKFEKVYAAFRIPPDFSGIINGHAVCPNPEESDPDFPTLFWHAGLRLHAKLPLLVDRDYSTVDPEDVVDHTITGSYPDYHRAFATIYVPAAERYFRLDSFGQHTDLSELTLTTNGASGSGSLRMQDHVPGIIVSTSGMPQHGIAKDEFVAADAADAEDWTPDLRWQNILATVFGEFDQHAEARWPEDAPTGQDVLRQVRIDVPNARLDFLHHGTVIGINADGSLQTSEGGYVRDDRKLLKDVARSAYAWYGQTRRALTVVQRNLQTDLQIGYLITNIGDPQVEINSVVTKLAFDLVGGTLTVQTQYGQFDPRNLGP